MLRKILVLTDEFCSNLNTFDAQLDAWTQKQERISTKGEFLASRRFNRLLSLSSFVQEHVHLTMDDLCQVFYSVETAPHDHEQAFASLYPSVDESDRGEVAWWQQLEFYTLKENAPLTPELLQCFQGALFFFTKPLSRDTRVPAELFTGELAPQCPVLAFNVRVEKETWDAFSASYEFAPETHNEQVPLWRETWREFNRLCTALAISHARIVAADAFTATLFTEGAQVFANYFHEEQEPTIALVPQAVAPYRRSFSVLSFFKTQRLLSLLAYKEFLTQERLAASWGKDNAVTGTTVAQLALRDALPIVENSAFVSADPNLKQAALKQLLTYEVPKLKQERCFNWGLARARAEQLLKVCAQPQEALRDAATWAYEFDLGSDQKAQAATAQELTAKPLTIAISSSYIARSPAWEMSPLGAAIIAIVLRAFPQARLVLCLDDALYSFSDSLVFDDQIIAQDSAALMCSQMSLAADEAVHSSERLTLSAKLRQECSNLLHLHMVLQDWLVRRGVSIEDQLGLKGARQFDVTKAQALKCGWLDSKKPTELNHLLAGFAEVRRHKVGSPDFQEEDKLIAACYVGFEYEHYLPDDVDLLITDRDYAWLYAIGKGLPVLRLEPDLSVQQPVCADYFLIKEYYELYADDPVPKPLLEQIAKLYTAMPTASLTLQLPKQTSPAPAVLFPCIKMSELLHKGDLLALLKDQGSKVDTQSIKAQLTAFYEEVYAVERFIYQHLSDPEKDAPEFADPKLDLTRYHDWRKVAAHIAALPAELSNVPLERLTAYVKPWSEGVNSEAHGLDAMTKTLATLGAGALQQVAQYSNYSFSGRYELQWLFLRFFNLLEHLPAEFTMQQLTAYMYQCMLEYTFEGATKVEEAMHHISGDAVLSVGCSRGDELADLAHYFPLQPVVGVDINAQALDLWEQLRKSRPLLDPARVQAYTWTELEQSFAPHSFGVITAMTVFCHHPQTLALATSRDVYAYSLFVVQMAELMNWLQPNGLICLFNANYRLEDVEFTDKLITPLFPYSVETKLANLPDTAKRAAMVKAPVSAESTVGEYREYYYQTVAQIYNAQNQAQGAGQPQPKPLKLFLPELLVRAYTLSSEADKFGYTALFDREESRTNAMRASILRVTTTTTTTTTTTE